MKTTATPTASPHRLRRTVLAVLIGTAMLLPAAAAHADRILIGEVADAGVTDFTRKGLPSPLADVLCDRLNEVFGRRHACRARGLSLRGVELSPTGLRRYRLSPGNMQFAVLRSDLQYWARGSEPGTDERQSDGLRALFALDATPVIAFTRDGKPPGRETTGAVVGDALDRKTLNDIVTHLHGRHAVRELSETELGPTTLCGTAPDYTSLWVIGHHNAQRIKEALGGCAQPAPVTAVEQVAAALPYLRATEMATTDYGGKQPIATVELARTVVTSSRIGDELVGNLLGAVFDNFYGFQIAYLSALTLDPEQDPARLFKDFQSAPLHRQAWRFYSRWGWMPEPKYVVLGAFRSHADAKLLTRLLQKKFPDVFDGMPPTLRRTDSGYYAVTVGGWVSGAQGDDILDRLIRGKVPTSRAYLSSALTGWGPDIVEQRVTAAAIKPTLYIHVTGQIEQEAAAKHAEALEAALREQGASITIPDIDKVGEDRTPDDSQLRYFKRADEPSAQRVLEALAAIGLNDVRLRYIKGYEGAKLRPQHLELWFASGQP